MTVVVADTSVYVSALVFGGVPQAALIKALTVHFHVAVSHALRAELVETLERKFAWPFFSGGTCLRTLAGRGSNR